MIYDINLLPKRKKRVSGKTIFMISFVCICCAIVLAFCGVYLPLHTKSDLNNKIKDQQEELQSYTANDVYYMELTQQLKNVNQMITAFDELKNNRIQGTEILNRIEECIPKNIVIESLTMDHSLLTIEALSPSYKEMAQFVVKAREIEKVLDVKFTNANLEADTTEEAGDEELHRFQMFLSLDVRDLITDLQSEQTTEVKNGSGEVVENEAH